MRRHSIRSPSRVESCQYYLMEGKHSLNRKSYYLTADSFINNYSLDDGEPITWKKMVMKLEEDLEFE